MHTTIVFYAYEIKKRRRRTKVDPGFVQQLDKIAVRSSRDLSLFARLTFLDSTCASSTSLETTTITTSDIGNSEVASFNIHASLNSEESIYYCLN